MRIVKARKCYHTVSDITCCSIHPEKFKVVLHKPEYLTTLIYETESWTYTKKDVSRLCTTQMKFIQSINQKTWDKIQN
jgi:hypothetical protein